MRIPTLAVLSLLATLAPLAAAHHAHTPCGFSQTVVTGLVHLDVWRGACTGAAVSAREDVVVCDGFDLHTRNGVHVLVLWGSGCQTGVIVQRQPVADDAATPLLP